MTSREVLALPHLEYVEKEEMNTRLREAIQSSKIQPLGIAQKFPLWTRWAAIILVLVGIGGYYFVQNQPERIQYETAYGEIKSFVLPDGSLVKLHANSQVSFVEEWEVGVDREVFLKGEAYFEVEKKPQTQAKFSVFTNDLKVEVLGTEFNVDTRKEKTEVVLNEGSIKLQLKDQAKQRILMKPGGPGKLLSKEQRTQAK